MVHKPEYLVVDTTVFIQNAPLQDMGKNIVTVQEAVDEITSKRQLRRLVVLPYDLKIMNVFPENIAFVTEFSKKTGDYLSLSATDIKLMALAYQLEKQLVGVEHLNAGPVKDRVVSLRPPQLSAPDPAGFFKGEDKSEVINNGSDVKKILIDCETDTGADNASEEKEKTQRSSETLEHDELAVEETDEHLLELELSNLDISEVFSPVSEEDYCEDSDGSGEEEEEDEDDSDWITPENVKKIKQEMNFGLTEDKEVAVACVTTDFAMQNVLKQIGLHIVGLDGRVIRHLRTFIFRCYACFKTTSNMTKVFCPSCGHKALKKVAVSVDENGQQVIHINPRRPLTARGKRFSLPMPKGGKHSNNPVLCEDQPMPDQRPTRLGRTKTNPLDDNYIAGFSPFVMRDVNSKSAMLGIRGNNQPLKYWMRKNPNEVIKYKKKKK